MHVQGTGCPKPLVAMLEVREVRDRVKRFGGNALGALIVTPMKLVSSRQHKKRTNAPKPISAPCTYCEALLYVVYHLHHCILTNELIRLVELLNPA